MTHTFDLDDLVWGKMQHYRPWPGRIIRTAKTLKRGKLCVQFYGNDDHNQVLIRNIHPYLDKVDEFTAKPAKESEPHFYTAINTIHEKYWNLIDLKKDRKDMGLPIDTDEEIELAIEERKADHWNPRILRRPLAEIREDDEDDNNDDPSPDSEGGKSKKDKKGASTKQLQNGTETKNLRKTRSKTETTCQNSKASTSGQSCKASTSKQNCMASTSGQNSKTVTSCESSKASCQSKGKSSSSKTARSSVPFPLTKRQQSLQLLYASTQETTGQNIEASTSKVINKETPQVNNRKRKSSGTSSLSEEDEKPSKSKKARVTTPEIDTMPPEILCTSPFQHLSIPAPPGYDIPVPKHNCEKCNLKYGFIGLKELSQSIIHPLIKHKHAVNVWSKDASKFNALSKAGARRTNTPARIISSSDVIFYCTKDPDISKNILLAREGVFDGCERSRCIPKIFVELTDIDVNEPDKNIRSLVKFQGGFYLQVKVVVPQIDKQSTPTFLCAGNKRVFAAVVPCLRNVTDDIHYFGTEFFWDAPMTLTPKLVEELVLQSVQKTTAFLYDLGFNIPEFEKIICSEEFDFGKVATALKEKNEAERNKPFRFYQDM
ncbi:cytokine-like nuclear factor N-PAC isoform X2 [Parasteatoda tepidariorum]|uniref:cytokine-like nuclear factor N-PAC isoform X2 n=1 Tax=Parasteatoda tepidariorum TaxID=114398 RepID=UPI00077FE3F6|nr:putative oxidoreductase GLYR1 isoform X2 [Parasteatoda tepidariorum]